MKKILAPTLIGLTLLGGVTAPIIPGDQEQLIKSYEQTVLDTPNGDLPPGYYVVLEDGNLYAHTKDTGPEMYQFELISEKEAQNYKLATIVGKAYKSEFVKSNGSKDVVTIDKPTYEAMAEPDGIRNNPTKQESVSLLGSVFSVKSAEAAIAFNAVSSSSQNLVTSLTYSHTVAGSDTAIYQHTFDNVALDRITGVTYNAVGMTLVNGQVCGTGCGYMEEYYITNPTAGANNVVISASVSVFILGGTLSYTGVKQTGNPENNAITTCTSCTTLSSSVTTVDSGAWIIMFNTNSAADPTAGTGSTKRYGDVNADGGFDSNGTALTPGSNSIAANFSSSNAGQIIISLAPVASAANNGFFNEF